MTSVLARSNGVTVAWRPKNDDRVSGVNIYRNNTWVRSRPVDELSWRDPNGSVGDVYYLIAYAPGGSMFSDRSATRGAARAEDNQHKPDAVVSFGDSFISGEAARWAGNSQDDLGSRDSTDRAHRAIFGNTLARYKIDEVYLGGTWKSGECHRGDSAPIHSARIPGVTTFNFACSGSLAKHVYREVDGDKQRDLLSPQTGEIASVVGTHDVELVVLSIGGNDLGFGELIKSCMQRFNEDRRECAADKQREVTAAMPGVQREVATAINAIRDELTLRGDTEYRFVLLSYPGILPRAAENRYRESITDGLPRISGRVYPGGCPFYDGDLDWARDSLVPQIDRALGTVARQQGVEFLSLKDAFQGKEVCASSVRLASENDRNKPDRHEWVRFFTIAQGHIPELFHPNYYGQQAVGTCLGLVWEAQGDMTHRCTNRRGTPQQMRVASS